MKITLHLNGQEKEYESKPVNFATLYKLAELQKKLEERKTLIESKTDDEIFEALSSVDMLKEIRENVHLIVAYFNNQFTYDEFMEGFNVESLNDFGLMMNYIIFESQFGSVALASENGDQGEKK